MQCGSKLTPYQIRLVTEAKLGDIMPTTIFRNIRVIVECIQVGVDITSTEFIGHCLLRKTGQPGVRVYHVSAWKLPETQYCRQY